MDAESQLKHAELTNSRLVVSYSVKIQRLQDELAAAASERNVLERRLATLLASVTESNAKKAQANNPRGFTQAVARRPGPSRSSTPSNVRARSPAGHAAPRATVNVSPLRYLRHSSPVPCIRPPTPTASRVAASPSSGSLTAPATSGSLVAAPCAPALATWSPMRSGASTPTQQLSGVPMRSGAQTPPRRLMQRTPSVPSVAGQPSSGSYTGVPAYQFVAPPLAAALPVQPLPITSGGAVPPATWQRWPGPGHSSSSLTAPSFTMPSYVAQRPAGYCVSESAPVIAATLQPLMRHSSPKRTRVASLSASTTRLPNASYICTPPPTPPRSPGCSMTLSMPPFTANQATTMNAMPHEK